MRNTRAFEQTIEILRSSAPSNRRLAQEIGSPAETNSVPTDRALCEYSQPPRPASPPAMHTDCFQRQGAVTSSRFALSAKKRGRASLAVWRTTQNGWMSQHLVSENNPYASRAVMLAAAAASIRKGCDLSAQNWFR